MKRNFTEQMEELARITKVYADALKKFNGASNPYANFIESIRYIDDELKNTADLPRCMSKFAKLIDLYDDYVWSFNVFEERTRNYVESMNQTILDFRKGE